MPRISRPFIDNLLARSDIVEVIDRRVNLKKAGREYKACCPFHGEKTPSFTVSPSKQFYHCFGCGASGNALGFIMDFEHMDFVEAVETLAQEQGITVEYEASSGPAPARVETDTYDLLQAASDFFRQQLPSHPDAVDYLKNRGLNGETARDWHIGFAPDRWDALIQHLSASPKALEAAGLISKNEQGRVYDKFRNRIVFPIRDRRGRVIAFGGRVMQSDQGPKYLNSPETAVFHKGQELFGLYEARKHNRKLERLIVVEGYMDVIGLYQHGVTNAVATLGTATTADHLQRLFRVVDEVVFCFDGDRAGRDAAWKALNVTLPLLVEGKEVYFLFLADGEDPDSLVKAGGQGAFEQALASKQDLTDFLFDELRKQHNLSQPQGMNSFVVEACQLIQQLISDLLRTQLIQRLAKISGYPESDLKRSLHNPQQLAPPTARTAKPGRQVLLTPMRMTVSVLLQFPQLARQISVQAIPDDLHDPGIELLNQLLDTLHEEPHLNSAQLLERFRDHELQQAIARLMATPLPGEAEPATLLHDSLRQLHKRHLEQRLESLLLIARQQGSLTEEQQQELQLLTQKRK